MLYSVALISAVSGCSPESDSENNPSTSLTYCDAKVVIEDKCLRCHAEGGDLDTPFFLDTYEEVEERTKAIARVIRNGTMPFMDPDLIPEVEPLTSTEKDVLLEWLEAGAPEGDDNCD